MLDTKQIATKGLLLILTLVVIFHLLVVFRVIPYEIVWGGRLQDTSEMLVFEAVSIVINLVMLAIVGLDAGVFKTRINRIITRIGLWIMSLLFLVNTIGNLLSINELEKIIFTPLTLLLFIFSLRLAINKRNAIDTLTAGK